MTKKKNLPTISSLPQAGVQLVPATVRNSILGSLAGLCDTPPAASCRPVSGQAKATNQQDNNE